MAKRSYFEEIEELEMTWNMLESCEIVISPRVTADFFTGQAYCIGSGGSFTIAKLWQLVFESNHLGIAKTMTPYEFNHTKIIPDKVFLFSASGKSHDILQAFKLAIAKGCKVVVFTVAKNSALMRLVKSVPGQAVVIYPKALIAKDGFLAVNSVIAMAGILARLEQIFFEHKKVYDSPVSIAIRDHQESRAFIKVAKECSALQIIASEWGGPAGNDLESRLAESGIIPCFLTDPRNFAHGRFIWLDRHKDSFVILFGTPQSKSFIKRFIKILPEFIPVYYVCSPYDGLHGAIYCLTRSIFFFSELAKNTDIDPGKPTVPDWGRKLHSLRLGKKDMSVINSITQLSYTGNDYPALKLNFSGVVLDIDGTLLETEDRLSSIIKEEVGDELNRLLSEGLSLAFATGRGKSALDLLKGSISQEFWHKVTVGLYNGTKILKLDENTDVTSELPGGFLKGIVSRIEEICSLVPQAQVTVRPTQITVEEINESQREFIDREISKTLGQGMRFVKVVHSAHSLDILPYWASKLRVVEQMDIYPEQNVLCIGDQGQLGGNDEELLNWKPSVSVGKSRPVSNACFWLGKKKELRGVAGTIGLLKAIESVDGFFMINSKNLEI